jgi:hypothetical protein
VFAKVPPVRNAKGYSKDEFTIDSDAGTADCPAGHTAPIRIRRGGGGLARFTPWCVGCPLRAACTTARSGRVINHPSARGPAAAGQEGAAGPGLAADLPQHPANGGTQDRPLHPTSLGRTQGPLPRPGPHPHRRDHPSRRGQPRQPGRARPSPDPGRVGDRLNQALRTPPGGGRPGHLDGPDNSPRSASPAQHPSPAAETAHRREPRSTPNAKTRHSPKSAAS